MRVLILTLILISTSLFCQNKDYKKYDKAVKHFNQKKNNKAKKLLLEILDRNSNWDSPNLLLAQILITEGDIQESIKYMLNAYDENDPNDKDGLEKIAKIYYQNGYYREALKYFQLVIDYNLENIDPKIVLYKNNCIFSLNKMMDSIPVKLVNLGPNINTSFEEYLPAISIDGKTMVFSRRVRGDSDYMHEDFYVSIQDTNNNWQKSVLYPGRINTLGNEGAFSFSPNKELVVYTACNRFDGEGRCDLYLFANNISYNAGKKINTKYWESQGCFSPDGKYLYFVSNRPGGYGGKDIWRSRIRNNNFLEPENLGPNVNSAFDEMSPYIHPDNLTLYFASNGHLGFGDFDLFLSRRDSLNGEWGLVSNLGYPINSFNIENSLIVLYDGETAYYTSNKLGFGQEDIFQFKLPIHLRANRISDLEVDIIQNVRGQEIVLENVVFATNSSILDSTSFIQLNNIGRYLSLNPHLFIQIQGHTDNIGNELDNMILSEKRAKSVYNYLLNITSENQLSYKGFGESNPICDNETSEGRRANRRTSFIILE